ncbi:hypothetical protein UFOVP1544_35 [uncultured Caudovirales phage]|uniref:Uncharacterized protein n=1 Tax=uncultured Caudovirales phage TaxID=2100421 RepID=A0A6J7XG62_9CAUD|nr:hypothetical protein UFOVP1544_35 [uncultured Caudovirales phage]
MALPNGAGGQQLGDGNLLEAVMGVQTIPTTLTADTTLTAAQVAVGLVVCKKASDATLTVTLPTAALLDAAITSAKVGSSFELTICNDNNSGASSTVPVTTGTGVTVFGSVTIARHGAHTYRFVKTGDAAYSAFLK